MKDVVKIPDGELFGKMFPHGTLDFILIVEGRGDADDEEIVVCENWPFSLQAVGSTRTGYINTEYVILCPYIDTSMYPQQSSSVEIKIHIGSRTYTIQSMTIKRISGNPVYTVKDENGNEWQIGTRIHFTSSVRLDW